MTEVSEDRALPSEDGREREEGAGSVAGRPSPHSSALTPSGIEIDYFEEPRRYYEIREHYMQCDPEQAWATHWEEVPSVSTVTDLVKDSGPLIWWGMRTGIKGALELGEMGLLTGAKMVDGKPALALGTPTGPVRATLENVEATMKQYDLRTDKVKDKAGVRGSSAHRALELWCADGTMPDPSFHPPEEQGYIAGLSLFLEHLECAEPEIIASERMVASTEHGFAGRYDLEIRTHKPCQIVYRWTPKRGPKFMELPPGLYVPDLKTSKHVYDLEHFVQFEGYELGRIESGYEPSDERRVIHVHPGDPDDKKQPDVPYYEFAPAKKAPEQYRRVFLAALGLYNALEAM